MKTFTCSQLMSLYDSYSTKVSDTGGPEWSRSDRLCAQPRPWGSVLPTECPLPTDKAFASLKPRANLAVPRPLLKLPYILHALAHTSVYGSYFHRLI